MRFSLRKSILAAVGVVAVVVPAGLAWACVALVGFKVIGSGTVQPGGTVEVWGGEFARGEPVHIRLDSAQGPILYTHPSPEPSTMTSQFKVTVPIPQDITPGPHVLVATQDHYDMNVGIPARAAIYVNTSAPAAPPAEAERPTSLIVSDAPGAGRYAGIALAVAAAGLLLTGVASRLAARRSPPPRPQTAS